MSVSMLGMSKQPLATQFELPVDVVASTLAMAAVVRVDAHVGSM
jgi:hypothetical protein